MGLLIYSILTFLLVFAIQKKYSRFLLLLLQLLPLLFVLVFLWLTRSNYQVLQIKKVGYQFEKVTNDFRQPARAIRIGGSQQKDDLFVADLAEGAVSVFPALATSEIDVRTQAEGVILMRNNEIVNGIPLKDQDRIRCGEQELVFHNQGGFHRSFSFENKEWEWPRRKWRIKKGPDPLLEQGDGSSIHLLSEIGKVTGMSCRSNAAFQLQQLKLSASRRPVRMNTILLIAAGSAVKINGATFPDRFSFRDDDVLKIYSIDPDTQRLHLAASYVLRNSDTFEMLHTTPQTLGIKEELLRNGSTLNKPLFLSTSTLPYSVFPTAHYPKESKRFSGLFAFVQTRQPDAPEALQDQLLERVKKMLSLSSSSFDVVTEDGTFRPAFGDHFALGKQDKIIFSLNQIQFPWTLMQILLVLLLLKTLFQAPFFASVERVPAQLLMVAVDFFLVTRILFSWRAATLYPFSSEAVPLSLLALALVPYLLFGVALCSRKEWQRVQFYNFGSYTLLLLVITAVLMRQYLWLSLTAAAGFCAFAFLRYHNRSPMRNAGSLMHSLKGITADVYLLLFFVAALFLQLLGAGEAIYIAGFRFPLALLYHPAFLLFSAYYAWKLKGILESERTPDSRSRAWTILIKLALVMLCFLVISLLTSDLGFFLLYCLPVLFLLFGIAALYIAEYDLTWKTIGLTMAAPLVLFLILFSGSSFLDEILPVSSFSNRYIQRILLSVDPTALEDAGLLTTERQLGHQRTFLAYARSGIFGAGYMNRPISPALSVTALNDNVPSAFLLNDFGIAGFVSVLLMLGVFAWLWLKSHATENLGYADLLSLCALLTFLFVDIYMIFSNCGIFLFTGKNVFLWGLNSISDVFHSTLILSFLIVVGGGHLAAVSGENELNS